MKCNCGSERRSISKLAVDTRTLQEQSRVGCTGSHKISGGAQPVRVGTCPIDAAR